MISLLRSLLAAIEGQPQALPADASAAEVLAVARRHRLSPLLSLVELRGAPSSLAETFRRDRMMTTIHHLVLAQVAEECALAFSAAGVPVVLLKGLSYNATIYRDAGLRPTGDIDLLVPEGARRAAFAALDALGFEPRAAAPGFDDADYHEVAWTRNAVEVDLHFALAPLVRCHIDYRELWGNVRETTIGKAKVATLHPTHAATFHALHMAIDHFDVPALYLVDFSRLLPTADERERAEALARVWGCWRPFATAAALTSAFLPSWAGAQTPPVTAGFSSRVVSGYESTARVPRQEQLVRKLLHFDTRRDAFRYLAVQGRRNVRELFERHVRRRSARQRLALER
jgi:putative nucleotidyltransferase-like protein